MKVSPGKYENPGNTQTSGGLDQDSKWAQLAPVRTTFRQLELAIDSPLERHELFLLDDGEKKVEYEVETRVPNAALFTFNKEDHTLGNLLRAHLAKHPHVLFAGYQVPHPLFAVFKLRVQTDGEISPKEAVVAACQELVKELQQLDQEFTKEWELKKIAVAGGDI